MTRAPILVLFVAFLSISHAQSDWHVPNLVWLGSSDQIKNHKPPLSSQELLAIRKVIAEDLSKCSKATGFENQCGENLFQSLGVRRVRIGAEGSEALVVQGWGTFMCGAVGNCAFWVLEVSPSGYHVLLSSIGIQTFEILKSGAAGYYDIVTGSHDSAYRTYLRKYRFDGKRYRRIGCAGMSYQDDNFEQLKTPRIIPERCK